MGRGAAWCPQPTLRPVPVLGARRDVRESGTRDMGVGRPSLSAGVCNKGGSLKIDFELQCRKGSETYRAGVYLSYTPCA